MRENRESRRRWLQFGVGTLLFLTLCLSGLLSGYQVGYRWGQRSRDREEIIEVRIYDVADLVLSGEPDGNGATADYQTLIDLIQSTVEPAMWDTVGGPGRAAPFETNLSIVISQTPIIHDEITDLLAHIRRLQKTASR